MVRKGKDLHVREMAEEVIEVKFNVLNGMVNPCFHKLSKIRVSDMRLPTNYLLLPTI